MGLLITLRSTPTTPPIPFLSYAPCRRFGVGRVNKGNKGMDGSVSISSVERGL